MIAAYRQVGGKTIVYLDVHSVYESPLHAKHAMTEFPYRSRALQFLPFVGLVAVQFGEARDGRVRASCMKFAISEEDGDVKIFPDPKFPQTLINLKLPEIGQALPNDFNARDMCEVNGIVCIAADKFSMTNKGPPRKFVQQPSIDRTLKKIHTQV